jgi:peroxiredoxin
VATGHGVNPVQAQNSGPKLAPAFSAKGSDGGTHTLKSLTNGKTLVLYFISSTCPVNAEAFKYYQQIGEAYRGKVNFFGVINEDEAGYKVWKKQFGNKFSVVYDKKLAIIRSYEAVASPSIVVVNPRGEIVAAHMGYSVGQLRELNSLMAAAAGRPAVAIDTAGAPDEEAFG